MHRAHPAEPGRGPGRLQKLRELHAGGKGQVRSASVVQHQLALLDVPQNHRVGPEQARHQGRAGAHKGRDAAREGDLRPQVQPAAAGPGRGEAFRPGWAVRPQEP
uniref:(northern house mosquito) hypothetical protein n=1 Tax=Culex pipiens TaxID=7175 RepID=A0A8D8NRE9_CULPI